MRLQLEGQPVERRDCCRLQVGAPEQVVRHALAPGEGVRWAVAVWPTSDTGAVVAAAHGESRGGAGFNMVRVGGTKGSREICSRAPSICSS